jgi:hypothetical protein
MVAVAGGEVTPPYSFPTGKEMGDYLEPRAGPGSTTAPCSR